MSAKATAAPWQRAGGRTHVLRLEGFAVNAGLVIGDRRAAVIDSGAGPAEAAELHAAVRTLTDLPLVLINTHAHGDHFFGNAYFRAQGVADIWAHDRAATTIALRGAEQRDLVLEVDPDMAAPRGPHTRILPPNRTVGADGVDLDLGGWSIRLFHLGPAHTDGDLLIASGRVLFAGDLVEEGAAPQFEDSFPGAWDEALGRILALGPRHPVVVPGHGKIVDLGFVRAQREELQTAIERCRAVLEHPSTDPAGVVPSLPYDPVQSRHLFLRVRDTAGTEQE
ncbi:MAG: MBL fold metallo-hydrolase [Arthrobacter sp.]|uniref:MBL fold metallo-hydrolase n=1 Tax=unclassified Arthrobacter TaxID=235627 RepID=UPI003FB7AE72